MKKLLLWLVMVVVMLAVLLGGAGYAMYAMTGDDKLPTQHPTLGDTELEPIGYDWSVPVLGNVLNRTFEQPSTLTVQKLGEMTEAAPELVLPDWAQRTTLTLKDSAGSPRRCSAVSASARAAWRHWSLPAFWMAASRPWKPTWGMYGSAR